jgi:SAM-dependent methyltransferase
MMRGATKVLATESAGNRSHNAPCAGSDAGTDEIARIRAAYERRCRELPPDFYDWDNPANYFLHVQTARACIGALACANRFPLNGKSILDVGCGAGVWLLEFAQWGAASLAGIDLDEARVARARQVLPQAGLRTGDARQLPWADGSFDVVTQFVMFTSVLDPSVKRRIASEMVRVLAPGGIILWHDFRFDNPRNRDVRGIGAAEIRSLFPGFRVELQSVGLAPPLARWIVPKSWLAGLALEKLPFLRTHYVAAIRE